MKTNYNVFLDRLQSCGLLKRKLHDRFYLELPKKQRKGIKKLLKEIEKQLP